MCDLFYLIKLVDIYITTNKVYGPITIICGCAISLLMGIHFVIKMSFSIWSLLELYDVTNEISISHSGHKTLLIWFAMLNLAITNLFMLCYVCYTICKYIGNIINYCRKDKTDDIIIVPNHL